MSGILYIDDYELSITAVKHKKKIYWVTTPHGIFIEKDKLYIMKFKKKEYKLILDKQAYWTDLALFVNASEKNIPLKILQLKVLKSHPSILKTKVYNYQYNISGIISNINFYTFLDITGTNRSIFYQITTFKSYQSGMSGSGFYDNKKNLIGLVSHCDKDFGYLIPGFFILKLINEKSSDYSPYLPIKLDMENSNVIIKENYNEINTGFIIKYFDKLKVSNGHIYSYEFRDNIPIDVYLQTFGFLGKKIKISDGKLNYELEVENLNNSVDFPFISGVSIKEKTHTSISYQDLWKKKDNPIAIKMINNMLLKDRM